MLIAALGKTSLATVMSLTKSSLILSSVWSPGKFVDSSAREDIFGHSHESDKVFFDIV